MSTTPPVFYSFRRCPYAMRARLALAYAQCQVELREIILRDKPQNMIEISPKATVPVLQLSEGSVIDESFDIMRWAVLQNDPDHWSEWSMQGSASSILTWLVFETDTQGHFKQSLDRYKYFDRYPERTMESYRSDGEGFIAKLENKLRGNDYLLGPKKSLVDMVVLPFVRQFAHVDRAWFEQRPYPNVQRWLSEFVESGLFLRVMKKYQPWQEGDDPIMFPDR
ncbi:MAG: glutathione S-transferase [Gammaproteobacteria bacterium]|nr:glutathione S-transferase [Gammaproteobacteria bacterium]